MLTVANYEGADGNYIVPAISLVGTLGDTAAKACTYDETRRDCVPTRQYDFGTGKIINFNLGINSAQIVRFYYAIVSSFTGNGTVEQGR